MRPRYLVALPILALVVGGYLPPAAFAADADLRASAPTEVDAAVLGVPHPGPTLATGTVMKDGHAASRSLVAAQAWPARAKLASMKVGDGFYSPTVGWATSRADGTFSLEVDPSLLTPDFVGEDGKVNLNLVAWDGSSVGRWGETAWLGSADEAAIKSGAVTTGAAKPTAAAAREAKPFKATVNLDRPREPRTDATSTQLASDPQVVAATCTPGYPWWYLLSTYTTDYIIGESLPRASGQTGWMKTSSSHTSSIGFGVSFDNKVWSLGGMHTENDGSGTSMTWPATGNWYAYTVREQYGKYGQAICGTSNYTQYQETEIAPTGTYSTLYSTQIAHFPSQYCDVQAAGTWNRYHTSGNSWNFNTGVKLKAVIGIDLKVVSSYTTQHDLFYKLTQAGHLCGKEAMPLTASSVEATN